jgi:DNA ligase-1
VQLAVLVSASDRTAVTPSRLQKIDILADLLARCDTDELETAIAFLTASPLQGKIGLGGRTAAKLRVPPAADPALSLTEVHDTFGQIEATRGRGSAATRERLLQDLFARATRAEQQFLFRLIVGELRQGALEGVLLEAAARALGVGADALRRGAMISGDLGATAVAIRRDGPGALDALSLEVLRPIAPMLADTAESTADALDRYGRAAFEWKLDGARIQVHRDRDTVRVFSRNLRDVTHAVPEVVTAARMLPLSRVILDGEVIALRPDGSPHPFQVTMRRFGRRQDAAALQRELPLQPFFFDCLLRDDEPLIDRTQAERAAALRAIVPEGMQVPQIVTADRPQADRFLQDTLARGHEGVMAKALDAPYVAGRRAPAWVKIKQARTLDLVVLAAEWGSGRRRGWLSNLHLGARHDDTFVMLGKTFKGLTDELLTWQTARFLELETHRDAYAVYVRPELVVEIAFNDVQESPHYPGGLALRFARVKGYRPDKSASEADTLATVQDIYRQQSGNEPPAPRLDG